MTAGVRSQASRKKPLRPARAEKTRARILEVAEEEFGREGFAGARVEEIARRVGIRRASLFYHFDSKEELYEAVLRGITTEIYEETSKTLAMGSGAEVLEPAVSRYVEFFAQRPSAAHLALREVVDAGLRESSFFVELLAPFLEMIREWTEPAASRKPQSGQIDDLQLMLMVAGSTLVLLTASPLFAAGSTAGRSDTEELRRSKAALLHLVRRLLDLPDFADLPDLPDLPDPNVQQLHSTKGASR